MTSILRIKTMLPFSPFIQWNISSCEPKIWQTRQWVHNCCRSNLRERERQRKQWLQLKVLIQPAQKYNLVTYHVKLCTNDMCNDMLSWVRNTSADWLNQSRKIHKISLTETVRMGKLYFSIISIYLSIYLSWVNLYFKSGWWDLKAAPWHYRVDVKEKQAAVPFWQLLRQSVRISMAVYR